MINQDKDLSLEDLLDDEDFLSEEEDGESDHLCSTRNGGGVADHDKGDADGDERGVRGGLSRETGVGGSRDSEPD